jgi:dsRNA-specific ribonuclease
MRFPHGEIEKKIGYVFRDKALLEEAFTHSTYANVHGGKDNERMEYLGDAVLQLVVTEWQYLRYAKQFPFFLQTVSLRFLNVPAVMSLIYPKPENISENP